MPLTFQVTALFVAPDTVAVNCLSAQARIVTFCGATVTVTGPGGGAVIVTTADADFDVSATLRAVTLTVAGEGTLAGAVYRPLLLTVPTVELPPATPFTSHVTAVFDVPVTDALN